jgi:RND family efflux transporter MFP subunit
MQIVNSLVNLVRRQSVWNWLGLFVVAGLTTVLIWTNFSKPAAKALTFATRRGPLEITVLEGGSLQALESQELKCEVRVGYQGTKILKIVEEGYLITEDDVKTNKVLIELDSSELEKQIVQQEIQYQSALASLIDAQQNYEIQVGQNVSDVKAAEQKVRFARMDFDKFLGDTVTADIIQKVGLDKLMAVLSTNDVEETANAAAAKATAESLPKDVLKTPRVEPTKAVVSPLEIRTVEIAEGTQAVVAEGIQPAPAIPGPVSQNLGPQTSSPASPEPTPAAPQPAPRRLQIDFAQYAKIEALGDGEAKQKLRKFQDDLQVAKKELGQSTVTLEGTKRLAEKGFVSRIDVQREELAFENSRLKVQTAETAQDLFLKYDFVKSAEESLSKFDDAVREFDKARRVAISKLAQAKARLKSAEGQHDIQLRQRNDFKEQLEKCMIRATKPGLVVYGGNREEFYGGEERIREGAAVRERQVLITIPDMSQMSVNVKIHESYIKKIKKGQKARITVDAFPDTVLKGEVTKVAVLPDSQNRWLNPDMKVYLTTVAIQDTEEWIKPGMSAKVEIMVNRLEDCTYVPVQAVSPESEKQVCYVSRGGKVEKRVVEIGEFNDEFIQIKNGITEGEQVLLRRPTASGPGTGEKKPKPAEPQKGEPTPTASANQTGKT